MLKKKIENRQSGILLYGLTPPKNNHSEEKLVEISGRQKDRIKTMEIDGLILYDIQDEQERCQDERPFPYMKTVDPEIYSNQYLKELEVPRIIYKCVGKYTKERLEKWVNNTEELTRYSVFVGAATGTQQVTVSLESAYKLAENKSRNFLLGGVAIPERHQAKQNEHERALRKMENGCRFFVSQAVYHVEASKNFLSIHGQRMSKNQRLEFLSGLVNASIRPGFKNQRSEIKKFVLEWSDPYKLKTRSIISWYLPYVLYMWNLIRRGIK